MDIKRLIRQVDQQDMLKLLFTFPEQFRHAVEIGNSFDFHLSDDPIKNIVFSGMGGSAIGGNLIISYFGDELEIPAIVNRNYYLPQFVDSSSLVVVTSFSGNTEESLSSYEDAKSKGAQILCITSGGTLKQKARQDKTPVITIPDGVPPRTALGYLSIPAIFSLMKAHLVGDKTADFEETILLLQKKAKVYSPDSTSNPALNLAQKLQAKIPIIYSTNDLLDIVALRWKGQFSENAKVLAFCNVFPELNHNEIVGWEQLPALLKNFQIIYLHDLQDHPRNNRRMDISKEILEQVTNPIIELETEGKSKLARLFSLIYFGDVVSYYLAILNGVDPTPIEKIQYLKNQLAKL